MSELNLKCPADFFDGAPEDWDDEYKISWSQVQAHSHNKMQYRKAWIEGKEEITTLRQKLEQAEQENERVRQANLDVMMHFEDMKAAKEQAEARVAELEAYLHSRESCPGYEYATTDGPRKAWYDEDVTPEGDGWISNIHKGRDGWERFDYHEEAYWMRLRAKAEEQEKGGGRDEP